MTRFVLMFSTAAAISYLATLLVKPVAVKINAVDYPNERKMHAEPVPRLGGLGIWCGFMISVVLFFIFQNVFPHEIINLHFTRETQGLLLGGFVILLVGAADDVWGLTPIFKFAGQAAAATVLVLYGVKMEYIGNPFGSPGSLFYLGNIGVAMTIFWVVAFTNIVNFIDGLDGLAAGISTISGITFFIFGWQTGQMASALVAVGTAGAAFGFLKHNFFPAKIFMGDSGSMFLGYIFGAITVDAVMKSVAAVALIAPLIIMGIPILDGALAVLRRYRSKMPVTQADRDHLHHRLIRRGLTHKQSVLFIYAWSTALSVLGLTFRVLPSMQKYIVIFAGLFLTFLFAEVIGFFDSFGETGKKQPARSDLNNKEVVAVKAPESSSIVFLTAADDLANSRPSTETYGQAFGPTAVRPGQAADPSLENDS